MLCAVPYLAAQCDNLVFNDESEHSFSVTGLGSFDDVPGITDDGSGLLGQSGISSREFVELNINKPADKLSFEALSSSASLGKIINVGVSTDGGNSYTKIYQSEGLGSSYTEISGIQLPENATNLVFYTLKSQTATLNKKVTNIKITQKTFLRAVSSNPATININYSEEAYFDFEFAYSNLPEEIRVESSSELIVPDEGAIGSGCGDYQPSYLLHVDLKGTVPGKYNETVTLTAGDYTLVIPVVFNVLAPYTVTVPPTPSNIEVGQALSESTLEGGYVDTPGRFEWETPDVVPNVGDAQLFNIIFYPDNTTYPVTVIQVAIDVEKKSQEIEWNQSDIENLHIGDVVELTATTASGLPIVYSVSDPSIANLEGNVLTALAVGEVEVYASQAGNEEYKAAPTVTAYITVSDLAPVKQEQEIVWEQDLSVLTVGDAVILTATATSGLEVAYRVDNEELATIDGNVLTALAEGTVTIYASQEGDDAYNPAAEVMLFAIISGGPINEREAQIIIWDQDFEVLHVGDAVELTATASSGLEVTYSVNDESLASIEGNVLTLLAAGQLEIYAHQGGDDHYLPATDEVRYATVDIADALPALTTDASVTLNNGTINVSAANLSRVEVFNANGQRIASVSANGQASISLNGHKGAFVMVCDINGKRMSQKIIIR